MLKKMRSPDRKSRAESSSSGGIASAQATAGSAAAETKRWCYIYIYIYIERIKIIVKIQKFKKNHVDKGRERDSKFERHQNLNLYSQER
jgi:hypothetical protein